VTVRRAPVDLSQFHAGQMVEHSVTMRAEGRYVPNGYDAFGRMRWKWIAVRWQAVHVTLDRSDGREASEVSPWYASCGEAETWIRSQGLILGGEYWHAAREETN